MPRYAAWLVSFCLLSTLVYGSFAPPSSGPPFYFSDKLLHLTAYLCIGLWHSLMFPHQGRRVFFACVALGALIEIIQGMLGYRDASFYDEIANATGSGIGVVVASYSGITLFQNDPA